MEEAAKKAPWFDIEEVRAPAPSCLRKGNFRKAPWTEEVERELVRLNTETELSSEQMRRELNAKFGIFVSRNAVIGKLARLAQRPGAAVRVRQGPGKPRGQRPRRVIVVVPPKLSEAKPLVPRFVDRKVRVLGTLPEMTGEVTELSKSLVDLESNECHWPLGKVQDYPPYMYCGFPALDGQPYCDYHQDRATKERK